MRRLARRGENAIDACRCKPLCLAVFYGGPRRPSSADDQRARPGLWTECIARMREPSEPQSPRVASGAEDPCAHTLNWPGWFALPGAGASCLEASTARTGRTLVSHSLAGRRREPSPDRRVDGAELCGPSRVWVQRGSIPSRAPANLGPRPLSATLTAPNSDASSIDIVMTSKQLGTVHHVRCD
jgi:hypothetical protein